MKRTPITPSTPEKIRAWRARSKPLEKGGELERRVRISPINTTRRQKLFIRNYGSSEIMRFFAGQPCDNCGAGPSLPAHVEKTRGAGGTVDHIIPLCAPCEDRFHQGRETFAAETGIDYAERCAHWKARRLEAFPEPDPPEAA